MKFQDVPIPDKMKFLPKDKRGYPIPVIIMRGDDGRPLFAANNSALVVKLAAQCRCAICGTKMPPDDIWFGGGPLSAFHPLGAYRDGPMHFDCLHYAMQVCPYLALPQYSGMVNEKTIAQMQEKTSLTLKETTEIPGRPQCFIGIRVSNYEVNLQMYDCTFKPTRPHLDVRAWKFGELLSPDDAKVFIARAIDDEKEREESQT
jgi:hypothetical protein